jgi:hypothetical protein
MPDAGQIAPEPYAIQYTQSGRESRKKLPPEVMPVLFDLLDALAANPDAFSGRVTPLGLEGQLRLYSHPSPQLQVTFQLDPTRRVMHLFHFVAPRVPATKPVFISYSHKDAAWLVKLKQFLRPLEDKELIRVWDDTEIRPGADWLSEIRAALASARVAVFLVTQDFLDSPFIREEEMPSLLQAAQDRGCLIFWIAVSSTTFEDSPLARIQGANKPSEPLDLLSEPQQNKVFVDIYKKMKDALN